MKGSEELNQFLQETLHMTSQIFLVPTMIVLFVCILVSILSIGSILMEYFQERKKNKFELEEFLQQINDKSIGEYSSEVIKSDLLRRQKDTILKLLDNVNLSSMGVQGVAQKLLLKDENHYDKIVYKTDLVAKLGPMFGLIGTLIPLGPGLLALGEGDALTLSKSLLIAFDTTIAGLIAAAICFIISRIRKKWYEEYVMNTQAIMEYILEEVTDNADERQA